MARPILMFCAVKAKFHYASWFEASSKLVRSWSQTGSKQVRSWSQTWSELKFCLSSSLLAAN